MLNVDADVMADEREPSAPSPSIQTVAGIVKDRGYNVTEDQGDLIIDGGPLRISMIYWEAQDLTIRGIPPKQTLERLACAAIIAAYPERGGCVQQWLDGRAGTPTTTGPKAFAWSHMAGWYEERGCENFYEALWEDNKIALELEQRLAANGAWRVVELLVGHQTVSG